MLVLNNRNKAARMYSTNFIQICHQMKGQSVELPVKQKEVDQNDALIYLLIIIMITSLG